MLWHLRLVDGMLDTGYSILDGRPYQFAVAHRESSIENRVSKLPWR